MEERDFLTNLEYYKIFYYAAKYGSMTAAAEKLCLTQPTVSSTIKKLEDQLGTELFVRNKKGVTLNAEGRILWNRVEPACNFLLAGEQELEEIRSLRRGTLSIASAEMSYKNYLLPVLSQFASDYPDVAIKVRTSLTESVLEMLHTGTVDLAILISPFEADPQIELKKIDEIQESFVCGERYKYLTEHERSLSELEGCPFVSVMDGSNTNAYTQEFFEHHGLRYMPDIEVTTIEQIVQSVINNLGIAVLPWEQAQYYPDSDKMFVIPIKERFLPRDVYVVTCKSFPPGTAAQVFLNDYLKPAYPALLS